jgi:quinol monooxygenase YgiN
VYEQLEATIIVVPEMDIFNNYILDEIIVLEVDHRYEGQLIFDEYSSDDEQQSYPIFDHYEDREYDAEVGLVTEDITRIFDQEQPLVEAHEEIVYTQPEVNQQSSVDQQPPTSILLPLVPTVYSKQLEGEKEICYQSHVFCHHFHDPVGVYMELYFSNVLEPVNFIVSATVRGDIGNVFKPLSYSSCLLSIIGIIKTHVSKLLEWLWWKFSFT